MNTIPRVVVEGLDLPRVLGEILQAPIRSQPLTIALNLGHLHAGVDDDDTWYIVGPHKIM